MPKNPIIIAVIPIITHISLSIFYSLFSYQPPLMFLVKFTLYICKLKNKKWQLNISYKQKNSKYMSPFLYSYTYISIMVIRISLLTNKLV